MKLPKFAYMTPQSLGEACRMAAAEGQAARIIAGGTDLLQALKYAGHDQIAGEDAVRAGLRSTVKKDPGPLFDWQYFLKKLRHGNPTYE